MLFNNVMYVHVYVMYYQYNNSITKMLKSFNVDIDIDNYEGGNT